MRVGWLRAKHVTGRPVASDASRWRSQGGVWTLAALWALLLVAAHGEPHPAVEGAAGCVHPRELVAERGWTRAVTCAPRPGGGHPLRGPARWLFGRRIDLNRADARLLEALPGIGPSRARAIVEERRRGTFDSVDALTRVRGIGARTVERLRPWLKVSPPPASGSDDRS